MSQYTSCVCSTLASEPSVGLSAGRTYEDGQAESDSILKGKTVVVVGAGGAGRALAFGAAHKGAKVIIANRLGHASYAHA